MFIHDKLKIINDYVTANEKQLKRLCFTFYKGHDNWQDLFQEAYLKLSELPESTVVYFKDHMKYLFWGVVRQQYSYRNRKSSPLKMISGEEIGENDLSENMDYMNDVYEIIEKELNREHGFIPMTIFMRAQHQSLRSIARESHISFTSLARYRKTAQAQLQRLLA